MALKKSMTMKRVRINSASSVAFKIALRGTPLPCRKTKLNQLAADCRMMLAVIKKK
jgi:hypothetical protein